jgi:hypothetical protein
MCSGLIIHALRYSTVSVGKLVVLRTALTPLLDDELLVDTDRVRVPVRTSRGSRRLGVLFMMANLRAEG